MPNSLVQMYVHFVWATWDRLPLLTGEVKEAAYACVIYECRQLGAKVICIGATSDHVHLLVELPATVCVADLAKQIKGSSSHKLGDGMKWQGAYAAFSVSKSLGPVVKAYIQNQERHHKDGTTNKDMEIAWEEAPPPGQ